MSLSAKTIKTMAHDAAEMVRNGTESAMWARIRLTALYEALALENDSFECAPCKYLWACIQKLDEAYPVGGAEGA